MKKRWSLRGQNGGASLLAVLLALIFVGILGVIITNITITNIKMREVEQSEKKNFYSAEEVLDELTVGLNAVAAEAMQNAYTAILTDYRDIMQNGRDIQQEFTSLYMKELTDRFWDSTDPARRDVQEKSDMGAVVYAIGNYRLENVADCLAAPELRSFFVTQNDEASFETDYKKGIFILKNIKISYTDDRDYNTELSTDMVFHTPVLNFDNSNVQKEFMRYALIADDAVKIGAPNISIDGSVYAGADGIYCTGNGSGGKLTGSNIVTRGDVTVESGCTLEIGSDTTKLWAENIKTTGKGSPSYLKLNGNCFISDDLMLNGTNSQVTLSGNYYGYNFQDEYGDVHAITDSAYSSAIMINGKNSRLDMQQLKYLFLAGRTYLSRGSSGNTQNQDIALGESVSVRTNQLAYYVPDEYLDTDDETHVVFTTQGISDYAQRTGVADITGYLDAAKPVVAYHYRDNLRATVRYYLNFASQQKANDFYAAYYNANKDRMDQNASAYVAEDALVLGNGMLYTLKGDLLYRDDAGNLTSQAVTIDTSAWEMAGAGGTDGIYWELSKNLAVKYKSLQTYLEESHSGVTADQVRFQDNTTGQIDKTIEPLFDQLVDRAALTAENPAPVDVNAVTPVYEEPVSGSRNRVIVVVNNESCGTYRIPVNDTEGIVIATGDVEVAGTFRGMILSGGTISFASNASVTADEILVSQLFKKQVTPEFQKYFRDYGTFSESVIGTVKIEDYLTYDNWKKNED